MAVDLTTLEYWDIDGVPLNTYAYNIASLSGRTGTTGLRGEDAEQAYRPGRAFRPKVPDSRTLTLTMWVQGTDPDTAVVAADKRAQFQSNLNSLMNLFYSSRRQLVVTKRWVDLSGIHVATALGQVISPISPVHTVARAVFVVEIFLADPFFYDDTEVVVPIAADSTASTNNPGVESVPEHLQVEFIGPLTNPTLTNTSSDPTIAVSYTGSIADGTSLVIDVPVSRAVLGGSSVVNVSYSGSIWPMEVFPGVNEFSLSVGAGTGSAAVTYRPAYF